MRVPSHLSPIGGFRHAGAAHVCQELVCVRHKEPSLARGDGGHRPDMPRPVVDSGVQLWVCKGCGALRGYAGELACAGCGLDRKGGAAPYTTRAFPRLEAA